MNQITDLYRMYVILADKLHYSVTDVNSLFYYEAEYLLEEYIKLKEDEKKQQDEQENSQHIPNVSSMMSSYESKMDNKINSMKNDFKMPSNWMPNKL